MSSPGPWRISQRWECFLLEKTDRDSGASLRGAVYEIYAAEDIVTPDGTNRAKKGDIVDIFTTDEKGVGRSEKLFLGRYEALEREALKDIEEIRNLFHFQFYIRMSIQKLSESV